MVKENSNAIRLAALQNKKLDSNSQNKAIHEALSDKPANKITKFCDSDNESCTDEPKDILQDVEELEFEFSEKPQFFGKKGEKLMTMQSKIGSDERFQLDNRFEAGSGSEYESEDEQTKDLKSEQEIMYSLMNSALGKIGVNSNKHNPSQENQHNIDQFVRFDPCDAAHEKFLINTNPKPEDSVFSLIPESSNDQSPAEPLQALPAVDERTFFEVNTDFNKVIESNDSTSSGFGFKFDFHIDTPQSLPLQDTSDEKMVIKELQNDSSDDEANLEHDSFRVEKSHVQHQMFFYSLNPQFKKEMSVSFKRNKSVEEIENDWLSNRQQLTAEYKKRHKDAIRFQKKFFAKA